METVKITTVYADGSVHEEEIEVLEAVTDEIPIDNPLP